MRNQLRFMRQTFSFSHRSRRRNESGHLGCSFRIAQGRKKVIEEVRKKCAQLVTSTWENKGALYPQYAQLACGLFRKGLTFPTPSAIILSLIDRLATVLYPGVRRSITAVKLYFSPFSTLPTITTTIYI